MPLKEDEQIQLANFPGASNEKKLLERRKRMTKQELDLEMKRRKQLLELAKQELDLEMAKRKRTDPVILNMEQEVTKLKRDLQFMAVINQPCINGKKCFVPIPSFLQKYFKCQKTKNVQIYACTCKLEAHLSEKLGSKQLVSPSNDRHF
jgi:hypothetical protein